MSSTKADLERAKKIGEVDLSEWIDGDGSTGHVCAISAADVLKLPDDEEGKSNEAVYAWVIHCFCDEVGVLLFEDNEDSRVFFGDRPFRMVQAICEAAMKVNCIGDEGQQNAAKN